MSFRFENGGLDQHKSRPDLRLHLKGNNRFTAAVFLTSSYLGIHGLAFGSSPSCLVRVHHNDCKKCGVLTGVLCNML
jgi:hypothetical protein